ncbi:MAG: ABC transporter permease [Candidatus Choladocola sp.]|nr:ABC transporter permease [Candidatus Choladocola sp.]
MGRLYRFNLLQILRSRQEMFWPLFFPLILGTLFYFTFGRSTTDQMQAVPAALVKGDNTVFEAFLGELDGDTLILSVMEEEEALEALKSGEVEGVYYSAKEPSLTVTGVQMQESILEMLLSTYVQNQTMMEEIAEENPLKLAAAIRTVSDYGNMVEQVSVSGKVIDNTVNYFYALIGMACLFGSFMGMSAAQKLRADQSPLAARRSIIPQSRLTMVLSEMLAVFTVQFLNICILLIYLCGVLGISFGSKWFLIFPVCIFGSMAGVSFGIFLGCLPWREGVKIGILVGSSLLLSFMAGLMFGNMKDIIEHHCPVLNRINPAALISDAFYSISVYDNFSRYRMNLLILAGITCILVMASFFRLRRERYDSI